MMMMMMFLMMFQICLRAFFSSSLISPLYYFNNANSTASGRCHPHFKIFTRMSKQLPFHPHFCFTKHINEWWRVNAVSFASKIEIWETAFRSISHTCPIDEDMPLTFWLVWLSLFLFLWLFFSTELLLFRYRTVSSATWQIF